MKLSNYSFEDEFPGSVGTLAGLQNLAIAYLFSDPRLKLVKLNKQEYAESQIVYRSRDNEQEVMLEAVIQAMAGKIASQESYRILSVGCGHGIFEKPFLQKLLALNKTIHFVGVDQNEEECIKIREWCREINAAQPGQFSFDIQSVSFDRFTDQQAFDIVLLIHSLYYFPEIERSIQRVYQLLRGTGMAILGIASNRSLLTKPYYYVNQRLCPESRWYSEDLKKVLIENKIPFRQEEVEFSVNITECFQTTSQLGKQFLDFTIGANTAYFSPLQLRLLLEYFAAGSRKMQTGKIMFPHSADLFYLEEDMGSQ